MMTNLFFYGENIELCSKVITKEIINMYKSFANDSEGYRKIKFYFENLYGIK
jgi:hypothetical protein